MNIKTYPINRMPDPNGRNVINWCDNISSQNVHAAKLLERPCTSMRFFFFLKKFSSFE